MAEQGAEQGEAARGEIQDGPSRRPRRSLTVGGALVLVGLGLVGIGPSDVGMVVTLAGLGALIFGIHTFGRLGPEGEEVR